MLSTRLLNRKCFPPNCLRFYSHIYSGRSSEAGNHRLADERAAVDVCREIGAINSRLGNLSLTAEYLKRPTLLGSTSSQAVQGPLQNQTLKLPSAQKRNIVNPTTESIQKKTFIQDIKVEIKEPQVKSRITEPVTKRIKKHAARMITLRRIKMKKHRKKRLLDRMYLKFRSNRLRRLKTGELVFRARLAEKVSNARKFNAEEYVKNYLEDFHTPLIPGTYQGKRLPQWLIIELMEQDKVKAKEALMEGKTYTTKETILMPGETVDDFVRRTWK